MKNFDSIDSKFRYVIIASLRAKELLKGAKPKVKSRAKNLIRVAQKEVQEGLIDYELTSYPDDEIREVEDDIFIGEEIKDLEKAPETETVSEKQDKKEETKPKKSVTPKKKATAKSSKKKK